MGMIYIALQLFGHYPERLGYEFFNGPYRWWIFATYSMLFANIQILLTQLLYKFGP